MSELFGQLGVNLNSLLAQGLNFAIILIVLTAFVYRPLLKLLDERRKKIEFGLQGAAEVEKRLAIIEDERKDKLREADKQAVGIIGQAEKRAGDRSQEIIFGAEQKASQILSDAEQVARLKEKEEMKKLAAEAGGLIQEAIVKMVEIDPKNIDQKLIDKAVDHLNSKI